MSKTTEFSATPELLKQLYEYSIIKNYEAGDVILDENARIRSDRKSTRLNSSH